ncbi:hypothetical protein ACF07B_07265 [Streptomyces sp. NPDC015532]|uniref:hypothetical protein n=1 Tax=Streptomyces sp. NPDC015532 TaxID=3364960 RepID=UPI0037005C8F
MKKITAIAATALTTATLLSGLAPSAQARPGPVVRHPWDKRVHGNATGPDGRHIVTRFGTSGCGWNHLAKRHNIHKRSTLAAAVHGNVDRNDHHGHHGHHGHGRSSSPSSSSTPERQKTGCTTPAGDRRSASSALSAATIETTSAPHGCIRDRP